MTLYLFLCCDRYLITGHDKMIYLWNLELPNAPVVDVSLPDIIFSVSFSFNGSQIAATCKDKKCRIFTARTGDVTKVNMSLLYQIVLNMIN